ncbi:MAG: DUF4349 domain-containing protein [Bacteroidales bacterium]|jgi:hypothetical protein|nr:DUF4349 domain-containing protein [Bacteroidales bacterium]
MKNIFLISSIVFSIFIISCGSQSHKSNNKNKPVESYSSEILSNKNVLADKPELNSNINRKIIKNANLSVEVYDFYKYRKFIDSVINIYTAYISNEVQSNSKTKISSNITIKVPAEKFNFLIRQLEKNVIAIEYKSIKADDVTEKFIDINARTKSKKKLEQRYIELLDKANTIEDILKIENELRIIREEIEVQEGKLKYLKNSVQYSTLNLTFYQELDYEYSSERIKNYFQRFVSSITSGWHSLLMFVLFIIRIWPLWIIVFIILYFLQRKNRKNKAKKRKANKSETIINKKDNK